MSKLKGKIVAILQKTFPTWDVSEKDIVPVTGFWKQQDVYRFQVVCYSKERYTNGDRKIISVGCWETMTVFLKEASEYGCHLTENNELWSGKP